MRDSSWRYYFLAIPAVVAALGIQYMIRKHHPQTASHDVTTAMKPSHYRPDSGAGSAFDNGGRTPASRGDFNDDHRMAKSDVVVAEKIPAAGKPVKEAVAAAKPAAASEADETYAAQVNADADAEETEKAEPVAVKPAPAPKHAKAAPVVAEAEEKAPAATHAAKNETHAMANTRAADPEHAPVLTHAKAETHASADTHATAEHHAAAPIPANIPNGCPTVEYRGDGPDMTKVTKQEWTKVMKQFHGVKSELLVWLKKNRHGLSDATAKVMEKQIANLKIQRPPAAEEPDLTWRGIGVWAQDNDGSPILRVGSGFVKLVVKQPARGKFEMARLVAQSWAPCELARVDGGQPWSPLLKCLGVDESQGCATGSYSEGGWAVSSALAAIVAPPGCTVPAFASNEAAGCIKKIQLPLTTTAASSTQSEWQEARR